MTAAVQKTGWYTPAHRVGHGPHVREWDVRFDPPTEAASIKAGVVTDFAGKRTYLKHVRAVPAPTEEEQEAWEEHRPAAAHARPHTAALGDIY
jgi:hypothetical protein